MAAESGHKNLLKILLDSGADAFHIGAVSGAAIINYLLGYYVYKVTWFPN